MIVPPVPTPETSTSIAAVGVVPDLRPGGLLVDRRIGRILELLRQELALRVGGGDLLGLG